MSNANTTINFRLHPRVFAALGLDLVTNDSVAIIELVKNSYDALATRVDVRFIGLKGEQPIALEVQDNGTGMTLEELTNVWAVVATPYKLLHPVASKGRKRRVSGEKGLGRLSTARLGDKLELTTKTNNSRCLHADLNWKMLSAEESIADCKFNVTSLDACPFKGAGTLVKITDLRSEWGELLFDDLSDQLSRLISPFKAVKDFSIWLTLPGKKAEPSQIVSAAFLDSPPYSLEGTVNSKGQLKGIYTYNGIKTKKQKINSSLQPPPKTTQKIACGPFSFEIRAWDFDAENLERLSLEIDMGREKIRKAIRRYKGLSVYRDGILVLPKSDAARDWLGLDLRRVSKLGTRLSTSQIVGYVAISSRRNALLTDTSDRERLTDNLASREFKYLLKRAVEVLEDERDKYREAAVHREPPLKNLFEGLTASHLVRDIRQLVATDAPASEIVPLVEDFNIDLQSAIKEIERRFYYYSRVASLGLLAATVIHEVRNKSVVLGRLISTIRKHFGDKLTEQAQLQRATDLADSALKSLERLADTFGPLATRSASKRRVSNLLVTVDECVAMRDPEIESTKSLVELHIKDDVVVGVDPGELSAIIINFLDNSLYWLSSVPEKKRRILFEAKRHGERVEVLIHDSGPGVPEGDEERIFWPGVTKKPEGLGMGLTVVSEIVSQHGGKTKLVVPGHLGGASFSCDLPLSK